MLYDYKSDEIVQDFVFDDLRPVIEDIEYEFYNLRRGDAITIYAPSNIAREVLSGVLETVDGVFVHEESHNELLYNDNHKVSITIGCDGCIFVETAIGSNGYIRNDDEDVIKYVHDSFSTKDIDKLTENGNSVLVFGLKEEPIEKKCICKKCGSTNKNEPVSELYVNGKRVTDDKEIQEWIRNYREIKKKVDEAMRKFWLW